MNHRTPEQRQKLAGYATVPRAKRPRNMRWLDEDQWGHLTNDALLLAEESKVPIPERVPEYVTDYREVKMDPLEWWWTQRLKAAYKRWKRRRITPKSIDSTLTDMMLPGDATLDPLLAIERDETAAAIDTREAAEERRLGKKLTHSQRAAIRAQMKPELEENVSRVFIPDSVDKAGDSAFSGIDRELGAIAGPGSFKPGKKRKATAEEKITGKHVVGKIESQRLAIADRRTWLLSIIPKEVKGSLDLSTESDGALERRALPYIVARQHAETARRVRREARENLAALRAVRRAARLARHAEGVAA